MNGQELGMGGRFKEMVCVGGEESNKNILHICTVFSGNKSNQ